MRPSDYPPPWSDAEAVTAPGDAEPIEVGVLVVGAGPAGLAAAIRLGQLMASDPETAAALGDVPVAVLEKGKAPGSHLLSGAVVDPDPLWRLLDGVRAPGDLPTYGQVPGEQVLLLTSDRALRLPVPPTMRNHGNVVVSVSQLGRFLAEVAEEGGAVILPETAGQSLLVADDAVVGVRTGDKGRGREGEELPRFEAGSDLRAKVTILAEGTQGHLSLAAFDRFGLAGSSPQTWALGVKEVWRVPRPLREVIHTMGWPLRPAARYREFGGSFVYPMGEDLVTIGMVVGLDYRDASVSIHDLFQQLKTHPRIRPILQGGERIAWGAKTIPEGGFVALPRQLHAPGLLVVGDSAGLVNVPALKGIHYAVESGRLAAEAAWRSLTGGRSRLVRHGAALVVRVARSPRRAEHAPGVRGRLLARLGARRPCDGDRRPHPAGQPSHGARRLARDLLRRRGIVVPGAGRLAHVRQAVVGLPVRQPHPGRPAEPHPCRDPRAGRARRAVGEHVPRAGLRGRPGRG